MGAARREPARPAALYWVRGGALDLATGGCGGTVIGTADAGGRASDPTGLNRAPGPATGSAPGGYGR
ncbi:hypothetical protein [Streptomyces sp. Ag109_O5-10]|uniref:hypothetical protein n=1 Tax=Streptomyces sp. Ag109_O5-10 TaxID=1855349 RepID=UPI000894927F|nr:hypothetical protein [Streptomyces sp. Ag109_O5-10]SED97372.1 hypothetical protein SAMN05216533_1066 [Streptomyces sp. Ag109_O5-10]